MAHNGYACMAGGKACDKNKGTVLFKSFAQCYLKHTVSLKPATCTEATVREVRKEPASSRRCGATYTEDEKIIVTEARRYF